MILFPVSHPKVCRIKDGNTRVILIAENIDNVDRAGQFLNEILEIKSFRNACSG
jgi:hypothetical protein